MTVYQPQDRLPILLAIYGRTVREVAVALGVSPSYASRLINGKVKARPAQIRAIERAITRLPLPDVEEGT